MLPPINTLPLKEGWKEFKKWWQFLLFHCLHSKSVMKITFIENVSQRSHVWLWKIRQMRSFSCSKGTISFGIQQMPKKLMWRPSLCNRNYQCIIVLWKTIDFCYEVLISQKISQRRLGLPQWCSPKMEGPQGKRKKPQVLQRWRTVMMERLPGTPETRVLGHSWELSAQRVHVS